MIYSCQKEQVPSIVINEPEIAISNIGGSQIIRFESNKNWTAQSTGSWCTVSPSSGDASIKSTTINVEANDSYDDRSCTITIVIDGLSKTITIDQSAKLGLLITQDRYDLLNDASSIEIEVRANVEYDVSILGDWISKNSTKGLFSNRLRFDIAKNDSYDNRDGSITIKQKNGTLTNTINVYQSQLDAIILSNKIKNLSNESHSIEVALRTNVNFDIIIPTAAKSWVSYTGTKALRTETLLLNIAANEDYDARSTEIYVKNKITNLQDTLTINQEAKLGLIVAKDRYDLPNDATTIEVDVQSNFEFEISIAGEWIARSNTKSLSSSKLYFTVAKNDSYDNRDGSIIIKQKNGTLSKTINVYQSQLNAIILTTRSFNLIDTAVILSVELNSNIQYIVNIPLVAQTWISQLATKALTKENLQFSIKRNLNHENRTAQIIVQQPLLMLADTLTITQEKAPNLPSLTTLDAYDISLHSAKSGGDILNDGGAPILARGICWDTLENPTIQNLKTSNGTGTGNFTANILDLNAATNYYVRAYATNRFGTSYGNQIAFTTTSVVAKPVISPIGGIYTTAQTATITCATVGAEIRYTIDSSDPIITSALYSAPIPINSGVTIKAKAFKTNWTESLVAAETYVISPGAPLIVGSSEIVQHIDTPNDFVFRLNNLNDKSVYFVFSNKNTGSTTTLPQIVNNFASINYVERSTVFSEPSFVVSGKPHITDFNNDPMKYPSDGLTKSQYQQHVATQPERYISGSNELLYDDKGTGHSSTIRKVVTANGKNLFIWVEDACWGPSSTKSFYVTQAMLDAFAPKFLNTGVDNDIYEWVTNICGEPWGYTGYSNLIPITDDIHIWLTDIDGDNKTTGTITLGYFYSRDNFLRSYYSSSNEKLMFTLDAVLFASTTNGTWDMSHYWPMQLTSTLAHEFTHMIYFYQKYIVKGQSTNTAINEMCAQCVEDLVSNKINANGPRGVQYSISNAGGTSNGSGRLPLYNSKNEYNLLDWSGNSAERLLNYSKTYALGAYLMRNYGGANLIKELIQNSSTGVNSIVNAVNSNGGSVANYGEILQRFGAANLLSDKTAMAAGYSYNTGSWIASNTNGINYNLGSINLYNYSPTPYIYNELPGSQLPGSNILYRAGSNLNGTKEWSFAGMNADTKLTVVIK